MRNKVLGMLVGGAVGDALGMPVETWTPEQIKNTFGRVEKYLDPVNHKWFTVDPECDDPKKTYMPAGSTTDDTQLTMATLNGIIQGHASALSEKSFDRILDGIANAHVQAMKESIAGWGYTTVEAINRLKDGVSWRESGKTDNPTRGTGNGVPMKCAPLAALIASGIDDCMLPDFRFYQAVIDFAAMTHRTQMAAESGILHCLALQYMLQTDPKRFRSNSFAYCLLDAYDWKCNESYEHLQWDASHLTATEDQIRDRITKLVMSVIKQEKSDRSVQSIADEYGGGSCYVYDSLPFSYAMFLRKPTSFESVIETANAGGDTDTNAKIVGEMFGALHGIEFFEAKKNRWMLQGLQGADEIIKAGNLFCDTLGIK